MANPFKGLTDEQLLEKALVENRLEISYQVEMMRRLRNILGDAGDAASRLRVQ